MSRHSTPAFRLVFTSATNALGRPIGMTAQGWTVKTNGRPTAASLAKYIAALEASSLPGGCNAHCGAMYVNRASLVRQASGEVVATYVGPMFRVIPNGAR